MPKNKRPTEKPADPPAEIKPESAMERAAAEIHADRRGAAQRAEDALAQKKASLAADASRLTQGRKDFIAAMPEGQRALGPVKTIPFGDYVPSRQKEDVERDISELSRILNFGLQTFDHAREYLDGLTLENFKNPFDAPARLFKKYVDGACTNVSRIGALVKALETDFRRWWDGPKRKLVVSAPVAEAPEGFSDRLTVRTNLSRHN